jgi:hypothetical protein
VKASDPETLTGPNARPLFPVTSLPLVREKLATHAAPFFA